VPIDADHAEICKPRDKSSDVYVQVRAFIESPINPPLRLGERHLDALTVPNMQTGVVNVTNNITININGNREQLLEQLKGLLR
jgi:hypothetical protein